MAIAPLYNQKNAYYVPSDDDLSQGLFTAAPADATATSDDDRAAHLKPMIEQAGADSSVLPPVNRQTAPQTTALMDHPEAKSSIMDSVKSLFEGDKYVNYTLPFLGILEAIGSQGKSPGTAALEVRNQVLNERKQKLSEEEKAVEMQAKKETMNQATLERKLKQEKQDKVKAIPLDAPDYAQQVAKIEMQYDITPEEAMNYQRLFKQQKSLSPQELIDLQGKFPNVSEGTFQNDPDGWRKQLESETGKQTFAGLTGSTLAGKEELLGKKAQLHPISTKGTALASGTKVANINPGTPQGQDAVKNYGDLILSGDASPDLKNLMNRNAPFAIAVTQYVHQKDAQFDLPNAVGDYGYWNNNKNKQNRQVINAFQAQAPALLQAVDDLKLTGTPFLDKHAIDALYATGNVKAANLLASLGVQIEDLTKAVAGGNATTDKQMELASTILKKGATPEQIRQMVQTAINASNERKMSMYSEGGIYGKRAAQNDRYLPDNFKQAILSGQFHVEPAQQARPQYQVGETRNIGGRTVTRQQDGTWQ